MNEEENRKKKVVFFIVHLSYFELTKNVPQNSRNFGS